MKEETDSLRKRFRKQKNERLASQNIFSNLEEGYKLDDPLLGGRNDPSRAMERDLNEMAHLGREAGMMATGTLGELYRNKASLTGTQERNKKLNANQARSQKLIVEIEKKRKLSDNLVKGSFYAIIATACAIVLIRIIKVTIWAAFKKS